MAWPMLTKRIGDRFSLFVLILDFFQFVQYKDNEIFDDDNHSFEKLGFYDIGDLHELYLIILFLLDNQSTVDLF